MVKAEIRSLIYNLLPKLREGSEYHNEVIDRAIEKAINQLYTETFARDPHSIQRYVKRFASVNVNYDTTAQIYYSNFPSDTVNGVAITVMPISLPDKASGVRRIAPKVQTGITFYPMDQREHELILGSVMVKTVTDKIGYCVTQDRVEYYNMTAAIYANGVRMDCVIPFSDYDENDQILIPEIPSMVSRDGRTVGGETFADMVLRILGVIRPQEQIDDNRTTLETVK